MRVRIGFAMMLLAAAGPARAEVFVLGNTETGQLVIRGNMADAATQAHHEAKAIRDTGWVQLYGDDATGWGAIACVRSANGVHFSLASGHPSELDAVKLARAGAQKIQQESGGTLMFLCAPRWNNRGQPIAFGSDGISDDSSQKPVLADRALGEARAIVRSQVTKDYRRDCLPPVDAARAELAPIKSGVKQVEDDRPPAKTWKAAAWCPPLDSASTGIRN